MTPGALYFILMIAFTFVLLLQLIPLPVNHGSTSTAVKHNGAACSKWVKQLMEVSQRGHPFHFHLALESDCLSSNQSISMRHSMHAARSPPPQGTIVYHATNDLLWHSHSKHLTCRLLFDICHRCLYRLTTAVLRHIQ